MENAIAAPKSRSIARRMAPLGLSVALLSGGSWGVYHYTTGSGGLAGDEVSSPIARTADIDSQSTASKQLKQLFASEPVQSAVQESQKAVAAAPAAKSDRYAQSNAQPADLNAEFALKPFTPTPDFSSAESTIPAASVGDRYANLAVEPSVELPSEAPSESGSEITRGQNAGDFNPLRTSSVGNQTESSPQARKAFADQPSASSSTKSETPRVDQAKNVPPNPFADPTTNALRNAQPLKPAAAGGYANSRYESNQPTLAAPPQADLGAVASRQPMHHDAPAQVATSSSSSSPYGLGTPESALAAAAPSVTPLPNYAANAITPTPGLTSTPGSGRPGERLLEGIQSPSLTIQKLVPEEIQVGKKCTFAIRVRNTGQRATQNVLIHDEVPLGTELIGTAPRATVTGSKVVWDLGTLSVGEERTVEMELIPTDEGELGSVATVMIASQASAKSRCTRPELALRLSSKPKVLAGQQHMIQIDISNPGSGDATGVMLLESIPAGVSHESGPALEFEIGTLKAGESRRLELVLSAEQAGRIDNVMTARADANLQVEASCQFEVIAPVLQLTVEGPQRRYLERPATFQLIVDNPGTASAKEVQLVSHLPKGMQFVSANNMGEYNVGTHSVHWSLAELPANERGTVELVALPIEPGDHTLKIATQARQGLSDQTEKHVLVEGLAALMFEVVDVDDPIEVGGETTFEIRVVNQGSKAAGNVQVVAVMPPGLRAISAQGETRHTIQGERVTFAPLPQLAPKADVAYRIQAQGIRPGDQRIKVQITTDEIRQPITKEESTRVYTDQ